MLVLRHMKPQNICQVTASNEPKTSEFAFFKRLKQNVANTSCRNPQIRESIPMRNSRSSNHARESGKLNLKDVQSSRYIKKPTSGEIGSFLTHRDTALDNSLESSATPRKEQDNEKFKCSSFIKTPASISMDSFLSATANASVKPDSQQDDGDIFLSKRLKLQQQIAKTLFPETDEVPKECDLVSLLLSRLLPESSRETLSQNPQFRQPRTEEISQLHLDSNIQLGEASNTSRKLLKASKYQFLDSPISASQSHIFRGTLPSGQAVEDLDASAARNSFRMLLGHEEGNEQRSSLNGIASGCWSNRVEDRNLLTWDNDLYDYSTSDNTSHRILKNEAYDQFSCDAYDNSQSCRFRDQNFSYEVLSGSDNFFATAKIGDYSTSDNTNHKILKNEAYEPFSYDAYDNSQSCRFIDQNCSYKVVNGSYVSFAAAKDGGLIYKNEIHDFNMDRGAQLSSPISWYDSCSRVAFERSRPCASSNLSCTEPDYLNDFENRRETRPLLLGWNSNESDMQDSTHSSHLELDIYRPPPSTCSEAHEDSSELEIYCPPPSWSIDHWDILKKSAMLHLSPYTGHDHDFQGHHFPQKDLVPRSPNVPFRLSYGQEQWGTEDSVLLKSLSNGSSFFFIPQKGDRTMMPERNYHAVEAFVNSKDFESNSGLEFNSEYECTDNVVELFGRGNLSSQFLISDENSLGTSQTEHWSLTSMENPIEQEDSFPLQLHTIGWKDTEVETDHVVRVTPCDEFSW
ncbi:uncharacterized protein [Spinacia oleracea]|uniref:Uncharacterized protein isoform X2 n=1 Tax=Spinacia oleracea TaxID=3562 RepID=A0ABM3QW15_SPIOL|nr:uncharacterized protein LOC110787547 isoform X2 [Spinacia oleracea]